MRRALVPSLALLLLTGSSAGWSTRPSPAEANEILRIQQHFNGAIAAMESRDVSALAPSQRANRTQLLGALKAYRDRGVFPHNYDFPGEAMPYFVDRKTGTLCAVAHLMESTGYRGAVDRVARMDNNVWVNELAGDREFQGWLDAQGITLAEAARIQVPYMGDPPPPVPLTEGVRAANTNSATIGLAAAASFGAWNAFRNSGGKSRIGTLLGATSAAFALGAGVSSWQRSEGPPALNAAATVAGGLGFYIAARGFNRSRLLVAQQRAASSTVAERTVVTPLVPLSASGAGAGVMVRVTF